MKKKSIKTKLLILLCISISMSFLILGLYNANSAYNSDYKLIKHQEIALSKDISRYLDGYFQAKFDILEASAASVANYEFTIDNQKIVHDLFLAKNSGNFALLFLGFEKNGHEIKSDGKYLTKERNNFDARKRPWYKLAVKLGKSGITKPYISRSSGKLVVSLFTPIKQNGKIIGVLGSDIYMTTVVKVLTNAKLKGLKSTYLVNKKGEILVHKNKKKINKIDETFLQTVIKDKIFFTDKKIDSKEILFAYKNIPSINWYVGLKVDKEVIIDDIKKSLSNQIFLYLVLLVVILAVILYFLNNILSSLKNFEEGLYKFFQYLKGEVTEISKLDIKDNNEFGHMAQVINKQIELVSKNMEEDKVLIDEVNQIVHKIKDGHIDHFIKNKTKNPALEELKNSLNEMIQIIQTNINHDTNSLIETINQYARFNFKANVKNPSGKVAQGLNDLCEIITQMLCKNKTNGEALSSNSNRLLQNVHTLNETTSNTAVSLEETASAIEEINSTVASNTEKINIIKVQSDDLLDAINNGQVLANKTAHAMDDINQQSNSIQEAISVIDQIAFQTNILSLNAAVEAATAGEAGKGFAVVAQEVRNLASRSAEAAKEIKELVEAGTDKTSMGKEIAGHMIDDYKNLNTNILNTANLINEITQAFNEQKISIEQISEVVNKLDSQTQNNAHIASLSNDIAEETSHIAQNILEDVSSKEFNS